MEQRRAMLEADSSSSSDSDSDFSSSSDSSSKLSHSSSSVADRRRARSPTLAERFKDPEVKECFQWMCRRIRGSRLTPS